MKDNKHISHLLSPLSLDLYMQVVIIRDTHPLLPLVIHPLLLLRGHYPAAVNQYLPAVVYNGQNWKRPRLIIVPQQAVVMLAFISHGSSLCSDEEWRIREGYL